MNGWQKPLIGAMAAAVAASALFAAGFWVGTGRHSDVPLIDGGSGDVDGGTLVNEAYERIMGSAVEPPDAGKLAAGAIKGMVKVLKSAGDPYALFYGKTSFQSFQELSTGRFSGIGVWLDVNDGQLSVLSVLPESPALEAGVKPGDVIEEIDGKPVGKMTVDEAVAGIKGPEGTEVELTISRDEKTLHFTIERASIEFPNLRSQLTKGDIGYVQLVGFARGAGRQLRDEIDNLLEKGADGIVLDLRDNGGGLFSEAIDVASVFIESGPITTYRSPDDEVTYDAKGDAFEDLPLVVLVNERSASASEIVAGAFQDRERAILVGETTFGKGSVQEVIPLSDASALKLTTAQYLTPDGNDINGDGIEPDVEVSSDDPAVQRSRAIEILKGIVLSETGRRG